jgi:hypothetical protein
MRLTELAFGTKASVTLVSGAPLGDPIELLVRGSSLSIRRADAATVEVAPVTAESGARAAEPRVFVGKALERGEQ